MDASSVTSTDSFACFASLSKLTGHLIASAHHAGGVNNGSATASASAHLNPKPLIAPPLSQLTGHHAISIRRSASPPKVAAWPLRPALPAHVPDTQLLRS